MSQSLPSVQKSASMTLMPIMEMYNISTRQHAAWGLDGYEVPKKYFDHLKVVQDRNFEEISKSGKATKNNKIVTKRGSYLEDEMKFRGQNPGPQKYDITQKWVSDADIEKGKKLPKNTKKNTFIEQIFLEQQRRGIPGPGKYNILKTDEQVKAEAEKMNKKLKYGERSNYLQEYEYLSSTLPGPGNYNPRPILPKIHKDNMSPDKWIAFHKAKLSKTAKSNLPDVGTYKMNYPLDYSTFGKMLVKSQEEGGNKKSSVRYLGTEERFKDPKKTKSKINSIVPGPGQYPLVAKWQGKEQKKDSKEKNWMDTITTGISKSIYYS
ncbi:hypothetical protein ABPG72_001881 [Tetrahymena utriculariae]